MINITQYLRQQKQRIDKVLPEYLPARNTIPSELYQAMVYSIKSGGKRFRPILTLATGKMLGVRESALLPIACAIEFIHTYSLIHDDLPAMDDDDFRRGKPTTHKVFGAGVAILTGDALLTQAFEVIATRIKDASLSQRLISEISSAVGAKGMVGGQVLDLHFTKRLNPPKNLSNAYTKMLLLKTAALIRTAVCCGGIVARAGNKMLSHLNSYGRQVGLAFQLKDDALDGSAEGFGRLTPESSASSAEPFTEGLTGTSPSDVKNQCLARAKDLITRAKTALKPFGKKARVLEALSDYVVNRTL